jgi:hypothetical protein
VQCQLLRGVPDSIVGARPAEVVTRCRSRGALRLDDREEGRAGAVDEFGGEGAFDDYNARPVGERANQLGLQCAAISPGYARSGVHEHVLADPVGQRIVRAIRLAIQRSLELVERAVAVADPGSRSRAHRCGHDS